jgi:hypothetical protein
LNRSKKAIALSLIGLTAGAALMTGCSPTQTNAKTASDNLSVAADNFEVQRKIVGINTRTDKYLFYVEGRCSIERQGDLVVTCKHGESDFRKHYIGQATDVAWVATQEAPVKVSEYHTRIILKPEGIIPNIELQGSWNK